MNCTPCNKNYDANVSVMIEFNQKNVAPKQSVGLGVQGTKLVIIESPDSIITKIVNFFKGIRLINQEMLTENKNFLDIHEGSVPMLSRKFAMVSEEAAPYTFGVQGERLVKVENPDNLSTKIKNIWNGISTNAATVAKVRNQAEYFAQIKASASQTRVSYHVRAGVFAAYNKGSELLQKLDVHCTRALQVR